jgi:ferredoxin-NADP reductase
MDEPARTLSSRLIAVKEEYPGVKTLRLKTPEDFTFLPGMWILLFFPEEPKKSRAYSLATSPLEKGYVEISFARAGDLTDRLYELKPGQSIGLRGPFGRWTLQEDSSHAVLISEGTGIAPFRSMCRYVTGRKLDIRLTLLYASRNKEEQLYSSEYAEWRRQGFAVHASSGDPLSIEDVEKAVPDLKADFYLCGDASFINGISESLRKKGVAKDRIYYEKWGDYSF